MYTARSVLDENLILPEMTYFLVVSRYRSGTCLYFFRLELIRLYMCDSDLSDTDLKEIGVCMCVCV